MSDKLTLEDIYVFLNDFPETNRLLGKVEFSAERVSQAIRFTIGEWNETPPETNIYTLENFPYRTTLLFGVAAYLFAGQAAFQERNHLTYSSGGISVDDDNRMAAYSNLAQFFKGQFKELTLRQKSSENFAQGWRTINSPYYSGNIV